MSEFKAKKMEEYIRLNYLFLDLLKTKNTEEEALKLMKQNLGMMTGALKDLGVEFDDGSGRIRSLNEKITVLEKELGNKELSFGNVSAFINNLKEKIKSALSEKGVSGSINVSFSPDLVVKISLYGSELNHGSISNWSNEEDFKKYQEEKNREHYSFIDNFDVEKRIGGSVYMSYTSKNIETMKEIVEGVIDQYSDHVLYDLSTMYAEEESSGKRLMLMTMKEISFTFFTLASNKSFSEALNSYYDDK